MEITLLIVGALISIVSSISTFVITMLMERLGKVFIYTKIVNSTVSEQSWGFIKNASGSLFFEVPLWIEIQNTANANQIIRDFNIHLYSKEGFLAKMMQAQYTKSTATTGDKITNKEITILGDNERYSFNIPARSLVKYRLAFTLNEQVLGKNKEFDELRISYYNTKNKQIVKHFRFVENVWQLGEYPKDTTWHFLK